MSTRRVAVVPHTHWDREWYESYQTFRLKLIDLLDDLIPLLEADPAYSNYLLDGQMAVVDDYLEARPEMEDRLRALAASGRLAMGPWYILVDEFLVTGETIVRDLQLGIERGAAFGGVTSVGYLPDMFGHIAQMPQLLRAAGFADTVLWRGVPSAITKTGFTWVAPDGTDVRAEYLVTGYGNGASIPNDAASLVRRVADHAEEVGSFLLGDLLFMNGSDHLRPQPFLGAVLREANALQDDFHFEVTSLANHLARAPREGLETWHGELRSGFRSNILMGVLSNRVDVKQLAAIVERHLERRAEPFAALFGDPERYPESMLKLAWKEVIRNAAHDSICACSVADVINAVLHRFNEARAISEGLAERALTSFGASLRDSGIYVVNPSARTRSGLVETVVSDDEYDAARMQIVEERISFPEAMDLDVNGMQTILSVIQGNRIDENAWVHGVTLAGDANEVALSVHVGPREKVGVELAPFRQELHGKMGANPDLKIRLELTQPAIRKVVGLVENVAGFGWSPFFAVAPRHPVHGDGLTLSNGLITLVVDTERGTYSVNGASGYGRLVDEGDLGDSYNYSPPRNDRAIRQPSAVVASVVSSGPIRGEIQITATYEIPTHIDESTHERVGATEFTVQTLLELRADDPTVRVTTSYVNPGRDHRVRVELPLPEGCSSSRAECAFTVVERGLTAEGRADEFGLPTFPSRRFVQAGGLTVAHEGLHEYELVDIRDGQAHALAITLLRSTGMLSRLGMTLRPLPAGPLTPVDELQMVGIPMTVRYAFTTNACDPYEFAEAVLVPLETLSSPGGGARAQSGTHLNVTGAEISAVQQVDGQLELRLFNPLNETVTVQIEGQSGWLVDLRGRGLEPFDESFPLRPHGIATIRLIR